MESQPQPVEQVELQTGKTSIGFAQLNNPTPTWVNWIFRTEFILNKAAMIWLSATTLVPQEKLKETILTLTILDFVVWGLGRFVGITKDQMEEVKPINHLNKKL